jgi:sporulation protein YlmC with PRC-barrel domain
VAAPAPVEVRLELLIGRKVRALNGRPVGRVEEVIAAPQGSGWVVREYHIGTAALLERLAARLSRRRPRGYRVPWDKLELGDPERPSLRCRLEDLERL